MTMGAGKYDHYSTMIQEETKSPCVIVWVHAGKDGTGFSVTATLESTLHIPAILRETANQIEADIKANGLSMGELSGKTI